MLQVAQVRPYLLFGSAPQGPADIDELARRGITGVLCLQTDEDLARYGLRWSELQDWYAARGIVARRLPIEDFSPEAIVANLSGALGMIADLLADGRTVYVHCTEGVSRSPTVVIAHLVRAEGLALADAVAAVTAARPAVNPYPQALSAIAPR